jgi:hypothetical protein
MSKEHRYYHTPHGFLMRSHRNMQARVKGKPNVNGVCYWLGLPCCGRQEFMAWAKNDPDFKAAFELWEANNFDVKFAPVAHRIKRDEGYVLGNIRYVPWTDKKAQTA